MRRPRRDRTASAPPHVGVVTSVFEGWKPTAHTKALCVEKTELFILLVRTVVKQGISGMWVLQAEYHRGDACRGSLRARSLDFGNVVDNRSH
jgi:hypothetical protein